jgi:hypothetical protein
MYDKIGPSYVILPKVRGILKVGKPHTVRPGFLFYVKSAPDVMFAATAIQQFHARAPHTPNKPFGHAVIDTLLIVHTTSTHLILIPDNTQNSHALSQSAK